MSRTHRAKRGDRRFIWDAGFWDGIFPGWHYAADTEVKYKESDNPDRDGTLGQILRRATNTRRRSDTRRQIHLIMKGVEDDFFDKENLYKGLCWHFD